MSMNGNFVDVVQSPRLSHHGASLQDAGVPIKSPRRIDSNLASLAIYNAQSSPQTTPLRSPQHVLQSASPRRPPSTDGQQKQVYVAARSTPKLPSATLINASTLSIADDSPSRKRKLDEELPSLGYNSTIAVVHEDVEAGSSDDENEAQLQSLSATLYNPSELSQKPLLSDGKSPVLIVNLYEWHVGYTICPFVPGVGVLPPTHLIPYCERYLLDCIDSGSLPLKLVSKYEEEDGLLLLKNGNCLLTEVRDFRRFSNTRSHAPLVRQLTLRQTNQTLQTDLNKLIQKSLRDRREWKKLRRERLRIGAPKIRPQRASASESNSEDEESTDEEADGDRFHRVKNDNLTYDQRLELERQLVNATAGPLCLDPSPRVGFLANRTQFAKFKWNTKTLRRKTCKWMEQGKLQTTNNASSATGAVDVEPKTGKWQDSVYSAVSEVVAGRSNELDPFFKFVTSWRAKKPAEDTDLSFTIPNGVIQPPPTLNYKVNCDVLKQAGLMDLPESAVLRTLSSENVIKKVEEYILETERRKRPHTTKLSIYQRNNIECYFGELEMESISDPTPTATKTPNAKPEPPQSTKCQFELGCMRSVSLYVKQFSDIFTEDGRRPCKITYHKMGQPPQVVYGGSYTRPQTTSATTSVTQAQNTTSTTAAPVAATVNTTVVSTVSTTAISTPVVSVPAGTKASGPVTGKAIRVPISVTTSSLLPVAAVVKVAQKTATSTVTVSTVPSQVVNVTAKTLSSSAVPATVVTSTMASVAATVTTQTYSSGQQRSVQIVLPQPRAVPQQQQQLANTTPTSTPSTIQVQIQPQQQATLPQIYAVSAASPTMTAIPTSTTAGANVNFNLNVNSAGIVSLTPQQVLTRPQIFNVNLQQHNQPRVAIQQHNQRLTIQQQPQKIAGLQQSQQRITLQAHQGPHPHQQGGIRIKQQPTLATLLLTGIPNQPPKPITVAIQPQPHQNIITGQQGNMGSPIIASTMDHQTGLSSPIMIAQGASPGNTGNPNSLSVNLNAISLDGQLIAVSSAPHVGMQAGATYHVAHAGGTSMMGGTPLSTMNFIRLANSNTHHQLRQGGTVSLMNPQGIIISSNTATHQAATITTNQQQNTTQLHQIPTPTKTEQMNDLAVPDLNTLLGNQHHHQGGKNNLDGLNLNLNLNVNLNLSGASQDNSSVLCSDNAQGNTNVKAIQSTQTIQHQAVSIKTEQIDSSSYQRTNLVKQEVIETASQGMSVYGVDPFAGIGEPSNSPTKSYASSVGSSGSIITLSDLLGSPPIAVVSSTTQSAQATVMNAGTSSIVSSTPRLSALLAGTPSADTGNGNLVVDPSSPSYGNLLDRLAASLNQPQSQQNIARVTGSRLNPIATATPKVVLEHPVLAATLTQQGNIVVTSSAQQHQAPSPRPTTYRQIAPAPAPQQQQQQQQNQQLLNLLGMNVVSNASSPTGSTQRIRISTPQSTTSAKGSTTPGNR